MFMITILLHSEMENGINPEFLFDNRINAISFMDTCLENNYSVEVSKLPQVEKE